MKHFVRIVLTCLTFLLCFQAAPCLAQQAASGAAQESTRIKSLRMDYDQESNVAVFTDDVYVHTGELEIWSDKMVVTFAGDSVAGFGQAQNTQSAQQGQQQGGQPEIKEVVSTGKLVRLKKGRFAGTCRKAVWDAVKDIITLTGDPVLTEDGNTLRGEVVRLYLAEDRSEVEGSKRKPVELFFTSPSKKSSEQPGGQGQ